MRGSLLRLPKLHVLKCIGIHGQYMPKSASAGANVLNVLNVLLFAEKKGRVSD